MITISAAVLKRCPYVDEADHGHLIITMPADAPELHALGEQVDDLSSKPVTHEQFTRDVLAILPAGARVMTTWETGRWHVVCSEGAGVMRRAEVLREPEYGTGAGGDA